MSKKQKRYFCPHCEKEMTVSSYDEYKGDLAEFDVMCPNDDCCSEGVAWNLEYLESFPINKMQRTIELIEG